MTYHLWDIESGSYVGQYREEAEALKIVPLLVDRYGDVYAASLCLGQARDDGTALDPLTGSPLLERARLVLNRDGIAALHRPRPLQTASS